MGNSDCSTTLHMLFKSRMPTFGRLHFSSAARCSLPAAIATCDIYHLPFPSSQESDHHNNRSEAFFNSHTSAVTSYQNVPAASGELSVIHIQQRRSPDFTTHSPARHFVIPVHFRFDVYESVADFCCRARSTAKSLTKSAMPHRSISKKGV